MISGASSHSEVERGQYWCINKLNAFYMHYLVQDRRIHHNK